ncbi:hypothetical protein ACP70R_006881 [Stipagrostis hirtigluma subsp. patula]
MLPRSQRSIFHLGEEGGDDHRAAAGHVKHTNDTTRHRVHGARRTNGRQRRELDAADAVVGLQILVQHGHRDTASSHSRIVLKQMVLPTARHRHGRLCSFLKACSLCRRELSPNKDVYMYRGDQGFCSEECRRRQILLDEAREREAMIRKERRGLPHHHRHGARSTAAAIRGAPRRLLAVA